MTTKKPLDPPQDILKKSFEHRAVSMNFSPKILQAMLGPVPAQFLQALMHMHSEPDRYEVFEHDGKEWIGRSRKQLAEWLAVPESTLFGVEGPVSRLEDLRLIYKEGFADMTLFRVDFQRVALFVLAALVLYSSKTEREWINWAEGSNLAEVFTCRKKCPQGHYHVSAFPSLCTADMITRKRKAKLFRNRTPLAISKKETFLRDALQKSFGEFSQDKLYRICFGDSAVPRGEDAPTIYLDWKERAPVKKKLRPLPLPKKRDDAHPLTPDEHHPTPPVKSSKYWVDLDELLS